MSSEKASNNPGLSPVKGQKPSLGTQTGSRNCFSGLVFELNEQSQPLKCDYWRLLNIRLMY
jgi:hypothetical protein